MSPLTVFLLSWLLVALLYSLRLSELQFYGTSEVLLALAIFVFPFFAFYLASSAVFRAMRSLYGGGARIVQVGEHSQVEAWAARVNVMCFIFFGLTLIEVAVAGYVPLLSMMRGAQISHFSFGISSVHGLVLALGSLLATAAFYCFLLGAGRRYLVLSLMCLGVFALLVTRKMIVVSALQMLFIWIAARGFPSFGRMLVIILSGLAVICLFGWIGDVRTGRELFLSLSNPVFHYPDWLPSGFMWIYMYLVTPILNFTNATHVISEFSGDASFTCSLWPRVIRGAFGCIDVEDAFSFPYQVSGAFNVATGYINIFMSLSKPGVAMFSALHGVVAAWVMVFTSARVSKVVVYSIIMQITLLMVFGNGFFNLNVLAQIPLAWLVFMRPRLKLRFG
ncbi:oligosaccharide repeat unit polymerase [Stenotrophomonas sp. SPM]|uniref:O-antigen polymerase n=1 Tax=Stenotrophomonas sp. SPM TaxID=2170735 RepID=UPI000DE72FE3|nr:O-antigen polymerase [Stenotrophomonas sp. SPM]PWB27737.1 oligosaccharide repeat unit polymerase [Stenotrophomonas sp. SPM]